MKLFCKLAVVNRRGDVIVGLSKGSITVRSRHNKPTPSQGPIIVVHTWSNTAFTAEYNLNGNIQSLFTPLLYEGRVILCLKEPSYDLLITKANPDKLTALIIYLMKLLPADSPVNISMAAFKPPIREMYFNCQRKYMSNMKIVIGMNSNLDQCTELKIHNCTLELSDYQVPIAGAIRKMKNLTTLRLENVELHSSTFIEIESKELKQLHLRWCRTRLPIALLFKNDLRYKDSLVELYLDGNQWSEVPNGVFEFRNLLKLSLNNNCITELPDKFTNLLKLEYLSLDKNQLSYLPSTIFQIENLLNLSLSENRITQLPDKFNSLSKLKVLLLARNQLQYLPPSICSLHLTELDIGNNEFNFENIPPTFDSELIVHSLKELSYRTILNHELKVEEGMLLKKFLKDLDSHQQCICGCKFVEGQELSFLCNLNDISRFTYDNRHLRVPIRGNVCNSFKSCVQDRFT